VRVSESAILNKRKRETKPNSNKKKKKILSQLHLKMSQGGRDPITSIRSKNRHLKRRREIADRSDQATRQFLSTV